MHIKVKYYLDDLRNNKEIDQFWLASVVGENPSKPDIKGKQVVTLSFTLREKIPEILQTISPIEVSCEDLIETTLRPGFYPGERYGAEALVLSKPDGTFITATGNDIKGFKQFLLDLLEDKKIQPTKEFPKKRSWASEE